MALTINGTPSIVATSGDISPATSIINHPVANPTHNPPFYNPNSENLTFNTRNQLLIVNLTSEMVQTGLGVAESRRSLL